MRRMHPRLVAWPALLLVVTACAPLFPGLGGRTATERVVLPGGEICAYAGEGATLAFDAQRLAWTCEVAPTGPRGLFGAPVVVGETGVSWRLGTSARRADGAGFELVRLESVDARVARFTIPSGETCAFAGEGATLAFDGRRVHYTCDGDLVALGAFTADERGLSATIGTIERTDVDLRLRRTRSVRVSGLELASGGAASAADGEKAEAAHAPLLGTAWALERIRFVDDRELRPEDPSRYTLTLAADGGAALQLDCNRGAGSFELDGERLSFSAFATTRAFCGADSLDQPFLEQIANVVSYRFEDGALVLATAMDAALVYLRPLD